MTEQTRFDRVLPGLFDDLAGARTPDYLEAAIERASSRPQRPAWTYVAWWLPPQVRTATAPSVRATARQAAVLALIGLLVALAIVAYIGSRQMRPPTVPLVGPAGNGVIAVTKDGDIFVADRPGGDLRPLVAGPEDDGSPLFSADGMRLAFVRASDPEVLMVADPDGTNLIEIPLEPFLATSLWSFAPDGRSLMTVAQIDTEKRVVIRPVDPAAPLTVLDIRMPCCWQDIEDPTFRPTNPQEILVVAEPEGQRGLYLYDLATGGLRTTVEPASDRYVHDAVWLPDGEHIKYSLGADPHIVAADGSGDRVLDALRADVLSPLSNDGTRIVIDVPEVDLPGDDSHQKSVVVRIDGEADRDELACGLGTQIECAWSWIWSPDDSKLIGTVPHWAPGDPETELPNTYLQADPDTGQVTELDWVDVGTPVWQRVAP